MRRKRSSTHSAASKPRPVRRTPESGHARDKLPEVTGCPRCQASYRGGRWTWEKAPADAFQQVCPACQRIADGYPAGVLHVGGGFAVRHRDEITALLRNVEQRESTRHALKRVMAIEDEPGGFAVTTTDAKLALALGRALKKAYAGKLEQPPTTAERENLVRVRWLRELA